MVTSDPSERRGLTPSRNLNLITNEVLALVNVNLNLGKDGVRRSGLAEGLR